ncbi:MAG: hypothetical protein DLM72_19470 [Candidatus Nitrosopolaris wilkensis]|nr:MAG: hypothetical protein DLM72_19470 [Candidatus Nitrosopolaris wilkensis]
MASAAILGVAFLMTGVVNTAGLLGIISNLAKGQTETCPSGYYLATNGLCYLYQQQQQPTPAAPTDHVLTKYNSTPDGFSDGNVSSIQVAFVTVKNISLGSYGNQYQMQGTAKNTSGHDISYLDINAMLIDTKSKNVGMIPGIANNLGTLVNGQSTSFSGVLNEDSQNAEAIAYKMTFGWESP